MLEALKLRKISLTKKKIQDLNGKQIFWISVFIILLILFFTEYSPIHWVYKFLVALADVTSDFRVQISRDIKDIKVILWTRNNPSKPDVIVEHTLEALGSTSFNKSHPVKILIHGFSDEPSTTWTRSLRDEYLKLSDYNIFSIDWEKLAISPWYTTAVKNSRHVGRFTADFITFLTSPEIGVPLSNFHIIGASLGGQAAGHVGFFTQGTLPRITGLDPSGPLFHAAQLKDRLDSSDAQFVDVIHSAGKWVGNDDLMGHADFFPNLGKAPQPGCEENESLDLSCSHFMSWKIFSSSIKNESVFYALKCSSEEDFTSKRCCMNPDLDQDSVVILGEHVDTRIRGSFYLYTERSKPKATKEESIDCKWL